MKIWDKAGLDFTHCSKGYCKNCTQEQRLACEKEVNRELRQPHNKGGAK